MDTSGIPGSGRHRAAADGREARGQSSVNICVVTSGRDDEADRQKNEKTWQAVPSGRITYTTCEPANAKSEACHGFLVAIGEEVTATFTTYTN
jgi:hypothetical protein